MSWLQNIQNDLVIVTGDGARYTPLYFNASVSRVKDFNVAKFEFVNVKGSLVKRGEPMGVQYEVEIMFDGEDNLTVADDFMKSADDKGAWNINHPIYGGLVVHPLSLKQDNGSFNVTTITGLIIETIGAKAVTPEVSAPETVAAHAATTNVALADTYCTDIPVMKVSDITALKNNVNGFFNKIRAQIANAEDYQQYFNTYNQVNNLLNNTVFDSLALIGAAQDLIMMPAYFTDTVVNRLRMLRFQLEEIGAALLATLPFRRKKLYENNGGALVCALCAASVTNITATDYQNRNDVLDAAAQIIALYNGYLRHLCDLQTETGTEPESYIPDNAAILALDNLVYYTVSSLFAIANDAKQERTYTLPEDSNVVLIAYKLYGLLPDDSTILTLIANNNIVGYELMELRKGREVIYYV